LIRNDKLEARQFFFFHFKGTPSQDQQKTYRRRLITFKVTLTGQSHFAYFFDSVRSLYAVTSTPLGDPLTRRRVYPPLEPKEGGTHSPSVEGARVPIRMTG
jgi:hypothetical protein